ncbi:hypothetical protein M758_6G182600 [Ceratodon purpureus]|nr:hypothetical protein M758_6G182600 [Ceratodon purpureus]
MVACKSRIGWVFTGGFCRMVFVYLLLTGLLLVHRQDNLVVLAQVPNAGVLYLDQKEWEVRWVAGNASKNEICANLDGCSAECSRVACHPLLGESLNMCTSVDNNEFFKQTCPPEACRDKIKLDYSRSHVTLPAPASIKLQTEVAQDICMQRMLDSTFKTLSLPSNYSLIYFGSTSGAFRGFPGREQNETQCSSFDPRWRPWYLNGIAVSRDLKILVDIGNRMGISVSPPYNRPPLTTYLDVTKDITLGLLQALSPGDNVEVFSFNNDTTTSLGGVFSVNSSYNYFNPSGHPELAPLISRVNALVSTAPAALSDLNGAISKAAASFNQLQSLKVIIVLSNGLFVVNSTTFPALALQKNQAKLMVYKLPTNDDGGDPFMLKTTFQRDICSVQGSFESLDALATANPLYSVRSYFTYLARVQLATVGNNVTWSNKYASVSQDQNAITPTYPAFGSDGQLIGVAGIDVVVDNLDEPLRTLVLQAIKTRISGTLQAPATIPMTCYYQNESSSSVCPGSTPADSSAICPTTDTSSTLADRTCCGSCGSDGHSKESGLPAFLIALISIAGLVVLILALVALLYWLDRPAGFRTACQNLWRRVRCWNRERVDLDFPGN